MTHQRLWILDFGSQYTQLIARRVRSLGVFCEILPCTRPAPKQLPPDVLGIVLSGGPASVLGEDAPRFDATWLDLGAPVLGICYGLQTLAHLRGGQLGAGSAREYGRAKVRILEEGGLFADWDPQTEHPVWMSHGDHVTQLPAGFREIARSGSTVAAIASSDNRCFGLQFHPEVVHTPLGTPLLQRFLRDVCGAKGDWKPKSLIEDKIAHIREIVGTSHVICGLSGGVDSAVTAALLQRAIPGQLTCIFVDNGLLRANEVTSIQRDFQSDFGLITVDASDRFLDALRGVSDPERKRKVIGELFIRVFEDEAKKLDNVRFLAQGTLYPDVIESVSVHGPAAVIKSHHNVGGLPEHMSLELIEPLRDLFKDEVRQVGELLGLSPDRVWRQPFPGPGLAIRCIGEITAQRVDLLRRADAVVREEIDAWDQERTVWQYFAALLPVRSVGVMGDARTYEEVAAIRAVHSTDGMTAQWAHLPHDLLARMSTRITNEVPGINRVLYDISDKPPATIEWE